MVNKYFLYKKHQIIFCVSTFVSRSTDSRIVFLKSKWDYHWYSEWVHDYCWIDNHIEGVFLIHVKLSPGLYGKCIHDYDPSNLLKIYGVLFIDLIRYSLQCDQFCQLCPLLISSVDKGRLQILIQYIGSHCSH